MNQYKVSGFFQLFYTSIPHLSADAMMEVEWSCIGRVWHIGDVCRLPAGIFKLE